MRLIPFSSVSVTKSGANVNIKASAVSNHAEAIIFAKYNDDVLESTQIINPSHTMNVTMKNSANKYKIFFWKNMEQMIPVIHAIESK